MRYVQVAHLLHKVSKRALTPFLSVYIRAAVNYQHWGAAKRWYGVPFGAAGAFEAAFRAALPEQFDAQPDLLFHLTAMLSPAVLLAHSVPVFGVVQVWHDAPAAPWHDDHPGLHAAESHPGLLLGSA
jgi:hypothetical protein